MGHDSPYHRLNLWRNPFGELNADERAELAIVDTSQWRLLFDDRCSVLQFVGPCGHGKTTHLLAIAKRLGNVPIVHFPEDGPRPTVPPQRPMIIDEAQRMTWWQRRSVLKLGGPLVFGTHVDFSKQIRFAGLVPTTVDVTPVIHATKLAEMLNRRIEASRFGPGPIPHITEDDAVKLQHALGASIREIEHHLYETFQRRVLEQTLWPPVK